MIERNIAVFLTNMIEGPYNDQMPTPMPIMPVESAQNRLKVIRMRKSWSDSTPISMDLPDRPGEISANLVALLLLGIIEDSFVNLSGIARLM